MEILLFSLNIVAPVFFTMLCGFILRRLKVIDQNAIDKISALCSMFFIPCLLFNNIYNADFSKAPSYRLLAYEIICILTILALIHVSVRALENDRKNRYTLTQGIFWGNSTIFGLPIVLSLCGEESTGYVSIMIAVAAMVFSIFSVLIRELYAGNSVSPADLVKGILKNPFFIASILGGMFALTPLSLPASLEKTVLDFSRLAAPLSLLILGASFRYDSIRKNLRPLLIGVIGRIVLIPGIFIAVSVLVGLRGVELATLMAIFASPSAVTTFSIAKPEFANRELAGLIVMFGSAFAVVTFFIWITILKYFNLV